MFVTNCISTTKIQKISEITNFFRHYFLSRTEVSYSSTDYSLTYYLPQNISKIQRGEPYTTDDLKESGSLLFTQNGIVKAIEFSSGWQKVNHFTKRTAVPGRWWLYRIYYDGITQENEIDIYLPMQ